MFFKRLVSNNINYKINWFFEFFLFYVLELIYKCKIYMFKWKYNYNKYGYKLLYNRVFSNLWVRLNRDILKRVMKV